jgi:TrbL/VirB6 plasmid conjugal transfer protein
MAAPRRPASLQALSGTSARGVSHDAAPAPTPAGENPMISAVQQAISALLTTYEPQFLNFGLNMFRAFATILIAWQGLRIMFSQETVNTSEQMFSFARLLMFIAFGYTMIAFYESPIPGFGVSFSNLITDQAATFANILEARSLELTFDHLDELWGRFVQPDTWAIFANLLYWAMLLVITLAKAAALCVVTFGMIATAVCALLGPIFVPFFIVERLDWLFWGWLKSFVQFAFIQVVAFAYLMIFERFVFQYLTTVPAGITEDLYLIYGMESVVVVLTFILGTLLIPSLTSAIFSGAGSGLSVIRTHVT